MSERGEKKLPENINEIDGNNEGAPITKRQEI